MHSLSLNDSFIFSKQYEIGKITLANEIRDRDTIALSLLLLIFAMCYVLHDMSIPCINLHAQMPVPAIFASDFPVFLSNHERHHVG